MSEHFIFSKLFDLCNYIFCFLILNLFFLFLNIPILLFFLFVGISNTFNYFPLFLTCLLPTFPTFNVLVYCMHKFFQNKGFNLIADLKKGLQLNLKQSFCIWFIELIFIFALYSNIIFFKGVYNSTFLSCIFLGLLFLIFLMTPFVSLLISLFSNNSLNVLRNALILTFKKPLLAITNILIFISTLILFEISPSVTFLFASSLNAFLFVFSNRSLIQELQKISKN